MTPLVLTQLITLFGDRPDPRKQDVRFPLRRCTAVVHQPDQAASQVRVIDIGLKSIGFAIASPIAIGTNIAVQLDSARLAPSMWSCTVTRVTESDQDGYRVGATFTAGP